MFQRRLNYGFNGYQVPVVPRASRSARGRGSIRKKLEDDQIHAFEILAAVAGNLLLEREQSTPLKADKIDQHTVNKNTDKREWKDAGQSMKLNAGVQRSSDNNAFSFVALSQKHHQNKPEMMSVIANSKNAPRYGKYFGQKLDGVRKPEVEQCKVGNLTNSKGSHRISRKEPMELHRKPPTLVSSDSCYKASSSKDCRILGSFAGHQVNLDLVSRDDDENSYGCSQHGTTKKAYRPKLHLGDGRIRNMLESRPNRAASNSKEGRHFNTNGRIKPVYRNWKTRYAHQRSRRISTFKRRNLLNRNRFSSSGGGLSCRGLLNSFEKGMIGDNSNAARKASSSVAGQQGTSQSGDCNVKLSIKSFRVPELFIEIPATATVGSLKRAVMEAVTGVLGDGLHVGILLQGKKVKDDSKTLCQTGISRDKKLHSLGFMLEPKHEQILQPLCTEDPSFLPPGGGSPWPTGYSAASILETGTSNVSPPVLVTDLNDRVENELNTLPYLTDISTDKIMPESKVMVTVPAMSSEPLAVVPFQNKTKDPEFVQRRIRRPFSVSEVEALVQAVEKLGTGRWRDVKLCAFDSAKHRTYVDLKDKWKTLVHTAQISPQQRRGEPVPQDLLDRVLAAHAYWSQQQAMLLDDAAV